MPADRQIRRGGRLRDPSENVLALVGGQARFLEKIDAAAAKHAASESPWTIKYFEALWEAERRRVNDLAAMRERYDKQNAETQTMQLKTTSDLVSTQLDKVTTSLSETLNRAADNISATLVTLNARLAKVEQFRYETGGRSSLSNPVMTQVAADVVALKVAAKA